MKLQSILVVAALSISSTPVFAQQTNIYQTCTNYRETYTPGYYDSRGNYVRGSVNTEQYNVNCQDQTYYRPNRVPVSQPRRQCAAAPIGAILGGYAAYRSTSRVSNRWWSVPLGTVTGGIVGEALCN
jgi:hypothetical protein